MEKEKTIQDLLENIRHNSKNDHKYTRRLKMSLSLYEVRTWIGIIIVIFAIIIWIRYKLVDRKLNTN